MSPQSIAQLFAAAPHRLLFFGGVSALLLSMIWWAAWLGALRSGWWTMPLPSIPAGWAHAIGMQYMAIPLFMFGFLLTVFPRWMNLPALGFRAYLPVSGSLFVGYVAFHLGLLGYPLIVNASLLVVTIGWAIGLIVLLRLLWLDGARTYHANACWFALGMGFLGLLLVLGYQANGDARLLYGAIKLGTFGLLLPIVLSVGHRMVPFFSSLVIDNYQPFRPGWVLIVLLALSHAHMLLELVHGQRWLWLVDLPMMILGAWLSWRWGLFRTAHNRLLLVLHLSFAWFPISFALFALQSLIYCFDGSFVMGRAPVHALTIGLFGSILVAMVTRVTQGHSGRPLQMGTVPWLSFLSLQLVAVIRVLGELGSDPLLWQCIAALAWVIALLPWALRSAWIYLTPRIDGKPG